jgi:polar amino acid transport system substrate-binding protein
VLRFALVFLLMSAVASAQEPVISVHIYDRPPLLTVNQDGSASGLVGGPASRVFAKAGLGVRWVRTPVFRVVPLLRANQGRDCAIGFYKTAERELYLGYSAPIYRDRPPAVLVRADYPASQGIALRDLLARPDLRLSVRQMTVYGETIDGLIRAMPANRTQRQSQDLPAIVKMIHAGRSDAVILADEESSQVIRDAGLAAADFKILHIPEIHQESRYIICSRQVPAQEMDRINQAIRELFQPQLTQ